ncbi:MAG: hypothetical protein ACPIOQ_54660, partial [Promethearchaeia archaeon]
AALASSSSRGARKPNTEGGRRKSGCTGVARCGEKGAQSGFYGQSWGSAQAATVASRRVGR